MAIKQTMNTAIPNDPNTTRAVVNEANDGIKAVPVELVTKANDDSTFTQVSANNGLHVQVTGSNVKDYIEGTVNVTRTYGTPMRGFAIQNDGTQNLTFTINGMTIPVKPTQGWDDTFDPFTTVQINATGAFVAVVKG